MNQSDTNKNINLDNNLSVIENTNEFHIKESNIVQLSMVIQYYEIIKTFILKYLDEYFNNYLSNQNNKLVINLFVLAITLFVFVSKFMTSSILNYLFLLENMKNDLSFMCLDQHIKINKSMWVTYGVVILASKFLDIISNWFGYTIVVVFFEISKCAFYYKLFTDPDNCSKQVAESIIKIYKSNKLGLDYVHSLVAKTAIFITSTLNEIMNEKFKTKVQ